MMESSFIYGIISAATIRRFKAKNSEKGTISKQIHFDEAKATKSKNKFQFDVVLGQVCFFFS